MQLQDDVPDFPRATARGGGRSSLGKEVDEVDGDDVDMEFESGERELNNNNYKNKNKRLQKRNHSAEEDDLGSLFGDGISGKLPRFANKITLKTAIPILIGTKFDDFVQLLLDLQWTIVTQQQFAQRSRVWKLQYIAELERNVQALQLLIPSSVVLGILRYLWEKGDNGGHSLSYAPMCGEKDIHVFGIFDGHRGAVAAEFSARALPGFLQSLGSIKSPSDALLEAFVKTDVAFRNELDSHRKSKGVIQKDWHPGCTAIVALIVRNKLFVANAGDCSSMLCRAGSAYALSKDHVASCPEEREHIISEGGQVKWQVDTWRVGPAALQVTRSIGDDDMKPVVTAEPEITETILYVEDEYLRWLWDVMSNAEIVCIIKDIVKEPGMCSKRLATEAAERGSKDNIIVIVVFLHPVSIAERIY
ncbi:unnamed protein product [Camellia sinensis]